MPSSTSPAGAPEENNWNVFKTDEVFQWSSHIPPGISGDRLTAWQEAVFRAGERYGILRVVEAVDGAYRYDRDGFITDWLAVHSDLIEPIVTFPAGFLIGQFNFYTPAARLVYAGAEGMTEAWFTSVAVLAEAAGLPPRGRIYPPISIDPSHGEDEDSFTVTIATATDIWFPHNDPWDRTGREPIDNRAVSARNAPRLNAFLTEFRAACAVLGGTWEWTRNSSAGIWEVDEDGLIVG